MNDFFEMWRMFKELNESPDRFKNNSKKANHTSKHLTKANRDYSNDQKRTRFPYSDNDKYTHDADVLSKQIVTTSDINSIDRYIGFVDNNDNIIKFDKINKEIVIYKCNSQECYLVTYFPTTDDYYKQTYSDSYKREITPQDDKYNV